MIALAIALMTLIALGLTWAAIESAAVRAYYAGRRDQAAGRIDRTRTDLDYVDGAATEYLRRTGGAA